MYFGRPFVKRVALRYQTVVCLSVCLSVCPVLYVCLSVTLAYCGQTVGWSKIKLGKRVGLGPAHIVLDGDPAPLFQRGRAPNFRPKSVVRCALPPFWEWGPSSSPQKRGPPIIGLCLLRPNGSMDQDAAWYGGRPRLRRHCVRWGPAPPKRARPRFSAHVYCGQTAECIRIPLGMEVGLSLGNIVLDGDLAPLP